MVMDETLYKIAEKVKNFAVIYLVDISAVPDFNKMYELYDPCTVMYFFRNKHIMIDLGTGNNNKVNWPIDDQQEMIDLIEVVFQGARKGRGLVISPKDYSTKYKVSGTEHFYFGPSLPLSWFSSRCTVLRIVIAQEWTHFWTLRVEFSKASETTRCCAVLGMAIGFLSGVGDLCHLERGLTLAADLCTRELKVGCECNHYILGSACYRSARTCGHPCLLLLPKKR